VAREFDATVVWMAEAPLVGGRRLLVKHGTRMVRAIVGPVKYRVDVHTLGEETGVPGLGLNDIGLVGMKLASTIAHDPYDRCRETGSFIMIDEATNATVGAGLIR
jgi:bifunctional enzyme CysN/CysC